MWAQWLSSFPDVAVIPLDIGGGGPEDRRLPAVPWLVERLLAPDERVLLDALAALAADDHGRARQLLQAAVEDGSLHPDVRFLAACCALHDGNCPAALDLLKDLYLLADEDEGKLPGVGATLRHIYPPLRCLTRITPTQLLPVYPSPYGAALLYAIALDACGQSERALTVLREMVPLYGLLDELRIIAARIHLSLGNVDQAFTALTHAECSEPDALEFTRSFYVAYCHYLRDEHRPAAQVIGRLVRTMSGINRHSLARARLLLAECYGRSGLLLDALRESGSVEPQLLPAAVAAQVLASEQSWIELLSQLEVPELERLADGDIYQVYLPEARAPRGAVTKMDTTRNPLAQAEPQALSWAQRQREAAELERARAAVERGEPLPPRFQPKLSVAGLALLHKIEAAEEWWKTRQPALASSAGPPEVSRNVMAEASQLRFDFRGNREPSLIPLEGEKRAIQLLSGVGAALAIATVLAMVRSCAPW